MNSKKADYKQNLILIRKSREKQIIYYKSPKIGIFLLFSHVL